MENDRALIEETAAMMPSFSRRVHESLVRARNLRFYQELLNVRPDKIDDRDLIYQPGLVEIKNRLDVPGIFRPQANEPRKLRRLRRRLIRRQGSEGSCTGQALAAVIDIQNLLRASDDRSVTLVQLIEDKDTVFERWWGHRASSRMLYEMARSLDHDPEDRVVGSTLRNAIKAFGQNGVCTENTAPYEPGEVGWHLTLAQAKEARRTGLGAYYRLKPILYDYHAALNEVGAIYVSAMIHKGWYWKRTDVPQFREEETNSAVRPILYPGMSEISRTGGLAGGHAFVIVGYDATGFLVLNSWGHHWGLWDHPETGTQKGLPGIALWRYDDWQDNVLDAWVFRLTVPSEQVFKKEGGYGKDIDPITGRHFSKTPRFLVNGHYINLKDGRFVQTGNLPCNEATLKDTRSLLEERLAAPGKAKRRYLDVMIAVNSGLEPITQGIHFAASIASALKEQNVFPLFIYWHYALLTQIENLISANLTEINARSGSSPAAMNSHIERYMRDYRGYFWERLNENVAKTAGRTKMPLAAITAVDLYKALLPIVELAVQYPQVRLHFNVHSDGVFVLDMFLRNLARLLGGHKTQGVAQLANTCRSITLFSPLGRRSDMRGIENVARAWRKLELKRRVGLVTLTKVDELRDKIGAYTHTYPLLAQNVYFPGHRKNKDELICGLYDQAQRLNSSPYYSHICCPESGIESVRTHFGMIRNPDLLNIVFNRMLGRKASDQHPIISAEDLFER